MFDHVALRVADLGASRRFYETVLATLGIGAPTHADDEVVEWHDFDLSPAPARSRARGGCTSVSAPRRAGTWTRSGRPAPARATPTTARLDRAPSTGRTTTAASCSTRTATAPRRSTTTTSARRATSTTCGSGSPTWRRR